MLATTFNRRALSSSRVSASAARIAIWAFAATIVLAVLVVGGVAVTLPGCTSCHSADAFRKDTKTGAHASVDCRACHVRPGAASRVTFAWDQIFTMGLRVTGAGGRSLAAVPDRVCLSCHSDILERIVEANGLKVAHSTCSQGRDCSDCHSGTAHGGSTSWLRVAEMEKCLGCHTTEQAATDCDRCHSSRSQRERLSAGTWGVTHGREWKTAHGMGDWSTCSACHPRDDCAECHGIALPHDRDFLVQHSADALNASGSCRGCHAARFCDDCHQIPMPHAAGFIKRHADEVDSSGDVVCMRCHVKTDCSGCHTKHVHPGGAVMPVVGGGS